MSTGTTVVEVIQALVALLDARAGLDGVAVSYARPNGTMPHEAIWFGDAEAETSISVMGGAVKKVDETYDLAAVVQVLIRDGRDEEAADVRAKAVFTEFQQQLAATPKPVDAVRLVQMTGWARTVGLIGETTTRAARYDIALRVNALLQPQP